jgi:hypothetical protein
MQHKIRIASKQIQNEHHKNTRRQKKVIVTKIET